MLKVFRGKLMLLIVEFVFTVRLGDLGPALMQTQEERFERPLQIYFLSCQAFKYGLKSTLEDVNFGIVPK